MRHKFTILLSMLCVILNTSLVKANDVPSYTVMQDDLAAIKADFNKAVDQVRLVFLPSPS